MSLIKKEIKGYIGYLTLNNPGKLNAMSEPMMVEMVEALKEFDNNENVRCVVLKGEGKAFSAGHDVSPEDNHYSGADGWRQRAINCNILPKAIWEMSTPIIAQVHGYCLGGACDVAAVCDLTIAADTAKFGEPEIQHNSHPPFPMLPYILNYKKVSEILLVGEHFSAQEALEMGLINRCVPMEELESTVHEYAMKLVKLPVPGVQECKRTIKRIYELAGQREAVRIAENAFGMVLSTQTPEFAKFCEIRDRDGMKAAFKWRNEFFADISE